MGKPMIFSAEDSKAEAIAALRDTMAAMRWELWERKGLFPRAELNLDLERKKLFYSVEEYPPIDWDYESSCIYHPHPQVEIIPPILIPKRENAFLFRERSEIIMEGKKLTEYPSVDKPWLKYYSEKAICSHSKM